MILPKVDSLIIIMKFQFKNMLEVSNILIFATFVALLLADYDGDG